MAGLLPNYEESGVPNTGARDEDIFFEDCPRAGKSSSPRGRESDRLQDSVAVQPLLEATQQQNSKLSAGSDVIPRAVRLVDAIVTTLIYRSFDLIILLTNITLMVSFYRNQSLVYFVLTVVFSLAPCIILVTISFIRTIYNFTKTDTAYSPKPTKPWEIPLFVFLPQMAAYGRLKFISENVSALRGYETDDCRKSRLQLINLANEAIAIYLSSNFLQSTLLFFLHWYYLTEAPELPRNDEAGFAPVFSLVWSLLCLTLTTVAWEESILFVEWPVAAITFMWKLFSNLSRLLTMCVCLAVSPFFFLGLCVLHWITFGVLIFKFTKSQLWRRALLSLVMGFIFIISDMDISCTRTLPRRIFYYTLTFIENVVMLTVWIVLTEHSSWYYYWFTVGVYLSFFAGLFFLRFQFEYHYRSRHTKGKQLETYVFGCCLGYPEYDNLAEVVETDI